MRSPIAALFLLLVLSSHASALILSGRGNDPVRDNNWPAGALELANLKTRIGWWEGPPFGGGEHHFCYRGDSAEFQKALDLFAAIRALQLELVIQQGPVNDQFMKSDADPKDDGRIDWTFIVWNAQSWYHLYNDPKSTWDIGDPHFRQPLAPPTLEVSVGGGGQIDWSKVRVPAGVSVTDERADANGAGPGSLIRGDVYDMLTSKPIEGADVIVGSAEKAVAQAESNANGHFEVADLPSGSHRIVIQARGYAPRLVGYVSLRGNTLKRFPAVRLAPAVLVAGAARDVTAPGAGVPLAGAEVSASARIGFDGQGYPMPQEPKTTTDEKGRFELTGVPRGFTHLLAVKPSLCQQEVLTLYAAPADDIVLKLTGTGTVKGKVVDAAGKPVGKGNVNLRPPGDGIGKWGGSMNVRDDGTFVFENVPPGHYYLTTDPRAAISLKGVKSKEVDVIAGKTIDVDIPSP